MIILIEKIEKKQNQKKNNFIFFYYSKQKSFHFTYYETYYGLLFKNVFTKI